MFKFLFKSFIGVFLLRMVWRLVVWVIGKKYKGRFVTRLVNGVDAMISTGK